ncbi:hypothetical protein UFOVP724_109 [uncultured Caudovirales phage]|uniref:Uncharacterized protein n=1 Tax=uncultured Caudovirales phage TaxID=2100421 RepID=A0A6J5NMZ1_9CAUD|nr:hypothetical protein UFOVP724_109 [uncultured Caudovirales phage]
MSVRYNENDVGTSADNILKLSATGTIPALNGADLTNLNDTSNGKFIATEVKNSNFTIEANKLYIITANNITITVPTGLQDYNIWGFVNFGKFTTTVSLPANNIIRNINAVADVTVTYQTISEKAFKEFVVMNESTNTIHYAKHTYNKMYLSYDDFYPLVSTSTETRNILFYNSTKNPTNKANTTAALYSGDGYQFWHLNYRQNANHYINTIGTGSPNFYNLPYASYLIIWKTTTATLTLNQNYHDPLNNAGNVLFIHCSPPATGSTWIQRNIVLNNGYTIEGFTNVAAPSTFKLYSYLKLISDGTKDWKIIESSDDWTLS